MAARTRIGGRLDIEGNEEDEQIPRGRCQDEQIPKGVLHFFSHTKPQQAARARVSILSVQRCPDDHTLSNCLEYPTRCAI
jgi:hypothetical protein